MNNLIFWSDWPKFQKSLFQLFLILLSVTLAYYLIGYFWSSRLVIQWETISKVTAVPLLIESWRFSSIPLEINVDQFLTSQIFEGSDLMLSSWPAALLLSILAACLVLCLALATDLSRFWFLVSQVAFIFVMVGFKLEQLLLFDRTDKAALILAFLIYLPTSYYFHAVRQQSPLSLRLVTFSVVTMIFGAVIYFYSGVEHPFLYLVGYGTPIAMAMTVVFIFFTGHEIIYGFLVLITQSNTPKSSNSFFHFFTISIIYLVNVLLLYLRNTRRIEWDFYYLDAFWILIAASLIGIWSLRQRGELFKNIMPVTPHGSLGYLAMASVSFATIGYFFSTANDPAIEAIEDAVVFSQLCIGFVFLLYILFNFRSVLIANLKVYKVVYKPQKMPFFSMRIGGFIGVLGLFLLSNQYPLDQAITAYYNGIGDLHRVDDKPLLAKEYYKLAAVYAQTNHRSNYAIASMEKQNKNPSDALAYFKQSIIKQPTPFAYVNTAGTYDIQGSFFKSMFTLKDGLKKFPGDPHISNNLAALYAKTELLDSAFYFLNNSSGDPEVTKVTQTNQLAFLAQSNTKLSIDSLLNAFEHSHNEVGSNLILMSNYQNRQLGDEMSLPQDSLLNPITFAWLYNYQLNQRHSFDSAEVSAIRMLAKIPQNDYYADNLEFAKALRLYYSGNTFEAFQSLRNLQFRNSDRSGFYNDLLGQWSLQQDQPILAADYFEQAIRSGYLPALWHKSLALIAIGNLDEAATAWNTYAYRSEVPEGTVVPELVSFIREEGMDWDSLSDQQKYWYLQYRSNDYTWNQKSMLLEEIEDPLVYTEAERWLWQAIIGSGDMRAASLHLQMHPPEDSRLRELQISLLSGDLTSAEEINASPTDMPIDRNWENYAKARLAEQDDDLDKASHYYTYLLGNPFFEEGVLAAVRFKRIQQNDEFGAYEALLEAISINGYSVKLLKRYGEYCARLNLDSYRETTLEKLQGLMSPAAFNQYRSEISAIEAAQNESFEESDDD